MNSSRFTDSDDMLEEILGYIQSQNSDAMDIGRLGKGKGNWWDKGGKGGKGGKGWRGNKEEWETQSWEYPKQNWDQPKVEGKGEKGSKGKGKGGKGKGGKGKGGQRSFLVDASGDEDEIHCAYVLNTPNHTPHASHAPTHITLSESATAALTRKAAAPKKKGAREPAPHPWSASE